jgi:hypothetical protein
VVGVLLNDTLRVLVRIERVHEHKGNVDLVFRVEVLDLAHGQVEERHAVANLDGALWPHAAHRRPETSVELEDGELVEDRRVWGLGKRRVRDDLLGCRRLDAIPFAVHGRQLCVSGEFFTPRQGVGSQLVALGPFGEVLVEEEEERVHLRLKGLFPPLLSQCNQRRAQRRNTYLPVLGVFNLPHEPVELVAHRLCGDTSRGRLEILHRFLLSDVGAHDELTDKERTIAEAPLCPRPGQTAAGQRRLPEHVSIRQRLTEHGFRLTSHRPGGSSGCRS